ARVRVGGERAVRGGDLDGIDEVFTTWGPRAPRSAFHGVAQLPPGGLLAWQDGRVVARRTWWAPDYDPAAGPAHDPAAAPAHAAGLASAADPPDPGELPELLADAVRLRLRADVPVGTYLSGGLDSSL